MNSLLNNPWILIVTAILSMAVLMATLLVLFSQRKDRNTMSTAKGQS